MPQEDELRAQFAPWYNGVQFLYTTWIPGEKVGKVGIHIQTQDIKAWETTEPTFSLTRKATQILMDDLWQAGFRPSEEIGSVGQLKATEEHLADMRRIAFKRLGIDDERKERARTPR